MLGLMQNRLFMRVTSLVVLTAFFPTAVQAWQFMPAVVVVVAENEDGTKEIRTVSAATAATASGEPGTGVSRGEIGTVPSPNASIDARSLGPVPGVKTGTVPSPADAASASACDSPGFPGKLSLLTPDDMRLLLGGPGETAESTGRLAASGTQEGNPSAVEQALDPTAAATEGSQAPVAPAEAGPEDTVAPEPTQEFEPLVVAQITLLSEDDTERLVGGQGGEAADLLAQANALMDTGDKVDASVIYIDILNRYPRTTQAHAASSKLNWLYNATGQELDDLSSEVPSIASLTSLKAKATVADLHRMKAYAAQRRDDLNAADAHFRAGRAALLPLLRQQTNDAWQLAAAPSYAACAKGVRGIENWRSAVRELKSVINDTAPSVSAWTARSMVAMYGVTGGNNPGESRRQWVSLLREAADGLLDDVMADAGVDPLLKWGVDRTIAEAYMGCRRYAEASAQYAYVAEHYAALDAQVAEGRGEQTPGGIVTCAAYDAVLASYLADPDDDYAAILAFQDFVNAYPHSPWAASARYQIATIYFRAEDYDDACDWYQYVIQQHPDTAAARVSANELAYILRHLYYTVEEVPDVLDEEQLAKGQLCGPVALYKLLASRGISSTLDELAALAGTDDTGTTMLGLAEAAKAKGLGLVGVETNDVHRLTPPFIAYVGDNHFVVVKRVADDMVYVDDMRGPTGQVPMATFAEWWGGQALVSGEGLEVARLLDLEKMKGAKGGCNPGAAMPHQRLRYLSPSDQPSPGALGAPDGYWGQTAVGAPGVHPWIHTFETALTISEGDLGVAGRGLGLGFGRFYLNEKGYHRDEFSSTSDPWSNNIGEGWTHNLNVHLKASTGDPPDSVIMYDDMGEYREYEYDSTAGGYDIYYRAEDGQVYEDGFTLKRNTSTLEYTFEMPGNNTFEFSAATNDDDRFARLESIVDESSNTVTLSYDGAVGTGKLTKVQSPSGDAQHLQLYYAGNLITKVELRDTGGALIDYEYEYNGNDELTKVTDHAGNDVTYAYDSNGDATGSRFITKITDKAGTDTTFAWTFTENESSEWEASTIVMTNAESITSEFDRSVSTSVNTTETENGGTLLGKWVYTPVTNDSSRQQYLDYYLDASTYQRWYYDYYNGAMTKVRRTGGSITHREYTYNAKGFVATTKYGTGPTTTYGYDLANLILTKVTAPGSIDTTLAYDSSDRVTKVTHPSIGANGVQYTYDGYGQVVTKADPLSNAALFAYNSLGQVTSATDPSSNTSTRAYDDYGNMTTVTDPLSKTTTYYYAYTGCGGCGGAGGVLTKVADPLSNEVEVEYDVNGQMTKTIDALDRETTYAYDVMGRITSVTTNGNSMTYSYDYLGRVITKQDFEGNNTVIDYDHLGRATKVTDPVDYVQVSYDYFGAVSTVTDGLGQVTDYDYDPAFRMSTMTDPSSQTFHYEFDSAGRLTKGGVADWQPPIPPVWPVGFWTWTDETTQEYNSTTGQLTKVTYDSGASTYDANYYYDSAARLTKLTDWIDGTDGLRYAYDSSGRLTQLTDYDDSTLTYTYDAAGRVVTMNDYHSNETVYTYTDAGQLSTLTAPSSKTWDIDYNANGQPTQMTIPNGMATAYSYDVQNRLTKIEHKDGESVEDSFAYLLDDNANITKITDQDDAYWEYWYDGRLRLTKADRDNSSDELQKRYTYTYDDGDNMLTKVVYDAVGESTATTAFEYTNANELTKQTVGGTTTNFTYDKYGRMTGKTQGGYSAAYAYRYGQMLYSVTSDFPGEGTVTYQYGGDGKRRSRTASGTTTNYNWDAGYNIINEEDSGGDLTMTYIGKLADVSGDDPSAGTWRYYSHDHLGSTRRLRAADKSSLGQYEYTPYGEIYAESGATIPWKYTSHMWDDTADLYYAPFRYYNPTLARWTTRDPLGMVDGPNIYSYASDGPTVGFDPLGRNLWDNITFLYDWLRNYHREYRYYGPDTNQVKELRSGPAGKFMRARAYMSFCDKRKRLVWVDFRRSAGYVYYYLFGFRIRDAGFQVGGFTGTVKKLDDGRLEYRITNTAGRSSFFGGMVDDVTEGAWGSSITQEFYWTEEGPTEAQCEAAKEPLIVRLLRWLFGPTPGDT